MNTSHSAFRYYFSIVIAAVVGAFTAYFILVTPMRSSAPLDGPNLAGNLPPVDEKQAREGIRTLRDEEAATIAVVREVNPAVVSIGIFQEPRAAVRPSPDDPFWGEGFPFQFPQRLQPKHGPTPQAPREKIQVGGGTGFIVDPDGIIITNRHVVSDEQAEYRVTLADQREFVATVVARDPVNDVAIIRIEAKNLPTVRFGDSDRIAIGQTAIAIGNALSEFSNTVTRGIISGVNRRVIAGDADSSEVIEEAIQTDAAINPGNSGGPLINISGEVIGVNTAVSREGQSVGFAIPSNTAKRAVESVKKNGRIVRPWLGVRYVLVSKDTPESKQIGVDHGALIVEGPREQEPAVVPDSPAAKAGLAIGDIILSVNDIAVTLDSPLSRILSRFSPGDTVTLKVRTKDKTRDVSLKLGEFNQP